jgi:hypothetical protein
MKLRMIPSWVVGLGLAVWTRHLVRCLWDVERGAKLLFDGSALVGFAVIVVIFLWRELGLERFIEISSYEVAKSRLTDFIHSSATRYRGTAEGAPSE